jgi:chorismate dehydratase
MTRADAGVRGSAAGVLRLGSVSYLNARPLIEGLEGDGGVSLHLDVPARLLDGLRERRFDVALLPVIDYQRMEGLVLLPAGGIGSDGPTLTVRVFSRVPIDRIRTLACDPDSHTSVALARIILDRCYGVRPELRALGEGDAEPDQARLLIGDKVVCQAPQDMPHQLDLGDEWKRLTGLPFVFAAWMSHDCVDVAMANRRLTQSRLLGMASIDRIVATYAVPLGWPAELARQYLTHNLHYEIGPRQLDGIRLFYEMALAAGMLDGRIRPLTVLGGAPQAA